MEYPIHPKPLMAHLLPGVYVEGVIAFCQINFSFDLEQVKEALKSISIEPLLILTVGLFFAALIIGHFLDAIRNLLEGVWDKCGAGEEQDHNWWDFFVILDAEKVAKLTDHYFRYYELDANMVIGTALLLPYLLWSHHLWQLVVVLGGACVFFFDARSLRAEIKRVARKAIDTQTRREAGNHVEEEKA